MYIGAQLYTVRDFIKTPSEFEDTLMKLQKIGYKHIQISGMGDFPFSVAKQIADKYSQEIVVTHTNPDRLLNDTEKVIEEHKMMGAKYVGIGSMPVKYHKSAEGAKQFIKDFTPVANDLKNAGLKFMYHNHAFEFEKFDGKLIIDYLIEGFSAEQMGFIVDVYWVQAGGADPSLWLNKLSGRIDVIHFKDMKVLNGKSVMSEVMEGNLNWDTIFKACKDGGVKYAFVEQDDCNGIDPFDCLDISYKNLSKHFNSESL